MTTKTKRFRRVTVGGAVALSAVMAVTSLSWACTTPEGATFFTNGTVSQSAFRGSRISAFATGARTGVQYQLVIGSNGIHPTHACHNLDFLVNPTIRRPTASGFIGPTAGLAGDATLAKGTWQVCFRDVLGNWATSAATLTII
ncbi:MAG: hypothetical protein ACRD2W_13765 [Acidimicrobiales bacterium]